MKCNLALYILRHMLYQQSLIRQGRAEVSLAHWRKSNDIPSATFARHVRDLIKFNYIERLSRDRYVLSGFLAYDGVKNNE